MNLKLTKPKLFAERSLSKVAGVFDDADTARVAARRARNEGNMVLPQVQIVAPGDPQLSARIEPEQERIPETLLRSHLVCGTAGAGLGLLLAFALALSGVAAVTSNLTASLMLLPLFGGLFGLLIGGAIALRPDIGRVAMTVRKETQSGRWVVVAHPVNADQQHGAERVFQDLRARTVSSL
ncbi:hypothetical protein [Plasticicumulans sp.]|uniref:hypothetical protein n=1 Tax=Plasticicumulans sp. TaxID=2307179 RepID=UPI000FA5B43B|nr:hypothetical protein [Plasticicumulans sp.]MBS0603163.1 hypothetical protein [Pseudomonadota bacterium]RTK96437.1 MAG: hypothetical protein EKK65_13900 [Xanthomonadales bacterium]HMV40513.1 hypothetical protein [Plasticicumulans sp.]HMW30692.1 hypothetical protein [Plasticicumulans sp.]HMW43994.1 hypothetical protein [Plasticicumulans sp.]